MLVDPLVELLAERVDPGQIAALRVVLRAAGGDDGLRQRAGLGVPGLDVGVDGQHGDALLVGLARLRVVELDLLAGLEHAGGRAGGAAAVGGGGLERDRDHDQAGVVGGVGQAVQLAAAEGAGGVGIEGLGHGVSCGTRAVSRRGRRR
ncbi:MAG: hypothetical protein R3F59_05385 [Myxococcota bacterium]